MGKLNCLITHIKMFHQKKKNLKARSKAQTHAVEDRQHAVNPVILYQSLIYSPYKRKGDRRQEIAEVICL